MKFKYNGKKKNMIAFGYDFSEENDFMADVQKSDPFIIKKLNGNRFFDKVDDIDKPDQLNIPELKLGVFKKKEDGKPYSRAEKVFIGTDSDDLKLDAMEWMEEKEIPFDERILMVK